MNDGIIKGTGDSRYLKGAGWPATYAEFKAMAEAGTLPFDLNGINEAGWQQIGDALNKANLLTDAVAALWGGNSSSKVTDILKYAAARYGTCTTAAVTAAKVVTLGDFALSVGAVIGVSFTYQNSASSPTLNVNGTGAKSIYFNGAVVGASQLSKMAYLQYDGTYWQLINGPAVQIVTGSYTGTGTYGSSNPNTLTFDFVPKIICLLGRRYSTADPNVLLGGPTSGTYLIPCDMLSTAYTANLGFMYSTGTPHGKKSSDGKTFSWYVTTDAGDQNNQTGYVYTYAAIG